MTFFSVPISFLLSPTIYAGLFIVIFCYIIHYILYTRQIKIWKQCSIPFLPPTFLLGHKYFSKMRTQSPLVPIDRIYRENADKELVAFFMTTIPVILLRDPKLIQKVAKCFDKAFLTGFGTAYDDVESQNMISTAPNREVWKFGRAALAPVFSTTRMSAPEFAKLRKQINRLWHYTEETRLSGQPLNVKCVLRNFVVDDFSLRYFGEDTNSYEKEEEVHQLITSFYEPTYLRMLSVLTALYMPFLHNFECMKLMSQKNTDRMTNLLKRKMAERDTSETSENDFVDHLRALRDGGVNLRQMVGFSLVLAIAGTETVGNLAVFAAHLLSLHSEYQNRIRQEVKNAMVRHHVSEFTSEVVQDLQFTEQCLLETIRIYPVIHAVMRVCSEDFQIPGTKYYLRKGDKVIIDPYSAHRDPQYYKNAETFDPERFSPENRSSIPPECFLGFGFGPRKCPGFKTGLFVASSLIASLLHKYELRPRSHLRRMDATDFNPKGFFLQPKEDMLLVIIPLEQSAFE